MTEVRDGLVKYRNNLNSYAHILTLNHADAQDLLQDTCVLALAHEATFKEGTNLKGWLLTIMRNHFVNGVRHKNRRPTCELTEEMVHGIAGVSDVEAEMYAREVLRDIRKLRPEYRDVLLAHLHSKDYEDAAKICGVLTNTFRSRLWRAREELVGRMK